MTRAVRGTVVGAWSVIRVAGPVDGLPDGSPVIILPDDDASRAARVEVVAKAIADSFAADETLIMADPWDHLTGEEGERIREQWRATARAALAAITGEDTP